LPDFYSGCATGIPGRLTEGLLLWRSRNGGRLKKTTIVALARKLLVALWKYVTAGVVIEGAIMKSA
jgi:hypothetical protein